MTGAEIQCVAEQIVADTREQIGMVGALRTVIFESDDGMYCAITATAYEMALIDTAVFGEDGYIEEIVDEVKAR
jgi:hypothetical protein